MEHVIQLSPEQEAKLNSYAATRQQSPDEALLSLLKHQLEVGAIGPGDSDVQASQPPSFADPWAGFRGRYDIPIPDLVERHDYYTSETAMETDDNEPEHG